MMRSHPCKTNRPILEQSQVAVEARVRDDHEPEHKGDGENGYDGRTRVEPCEALQGSAPWGRRSVHYNGLGAMLGHLESQQGCRPNRILLELDDAVAETRLKLALSR